MKNPKYHKYPFILKIDKLVMTPSTKDWCFKPYPGHPKGCPRAHTNCWQGGRIPMHMLTDRMSTKKPMYIVFNEFNLEAHKNKMAKRHPHWTEKQCRNILYWQKTSWKQLDQKMELALRAIKPTPDIYSSGEGEGVNLYKTCVLAGLKLDPIGPKMKICRHMYIVGYSK